MTKKQVQVKLRELSNQILNSDLIIPDKRNDVRDIIQKLINEIK
jgi:hypothetical protein